MSNIKTQKKLIKRYTKKQTKKQYNRQLKRQTKKVINNYNLNGSGFLNTVSKQIFSNTQTKNYTTRFPGSGFIKTTKDLVSSLATSSSQLPNILTILYNYKTPYQIIITNKNVKNVLESSKVITAPHIRIDNNSHFILVMILPGVKPKLMWAVEFNQRSKINTIINYLLPIYNVGQRYKLLFKLYRYPNNIKKPFVLVDIATKKRKRAYNKLQKYLTRHNMLNSSIDYKELTIRQDKGSSVDDILTSLIK